MSDSFYCGLRTQHGFTLPTYTIASQHEMSRRHAAARRRVAGVFLVNFGRRGALLPQIARRQPVLAAGPTCRRASTAALVTPPFCMLQRIHTTATRRCSIPPASLLWLQNSYCCWLPSTRIYPPLPAGLVEYEKRRIPRKLTVDLTEAGARLFGLLSRFGLSVNQHTHFMRARGLCQLRAPYSAEARQNRGSTATESSSPGRRRTAG